MVRSRLVLLDVPDPLLRLEKSLWRQKRISLKNAFASALVDTAHSPLVGLLRAPKGLPGALAVDLGLPVDAIDPDRPHDLTSSLYHALGVMPSVESSPQQRIADFRAALNRLRATGALVVLATVVQDPRSQLRIRPPSTSELLEELMVASGATLHAETLTSIRWVGEPIIRGLALTMRYLPAARR